jgi:hypothetical protein
MMMTAIPDNPDALLRRKQTAKALSAAGYPTAEKTLATKATRGGASPYRTWGRTVLYRWGDSLAWAEGRLSEPRHSTSEADATRQLADPTAASV